MRVATSACLGSRKACPLPNPPLRTGEGTGAGRKRGVRCKAPGPVDVIAHVIVDVHVNGTATVIVDVIVNVDVDVDVDVNANVNVDVIVNVDGRCVRAYGAGDLVASSSRCPLLLVSLTFPMPRTNQKLLTEPSLGSVRLTCSAWNVP